MQVRRLLLILSLLVLFPAVLLAQEDDTDPLADALPIAPGEIVTGELTVDSPLTYYRFSAKAGDTVTISLVSPGDEVDTYLLLLNADGAQLTFDDDSGGGRNSLIEDYEIPVDGDFIIVANSYGLVTADQPRFGRFELTLALVPADQSADAAQAQTEAPTEPPAEQTPETTLTEEATPEPETTDAAISSAEPVAVTLNETLNGEISANNPMASYQFSAITGNLLSIIVTSDSFDPQLVVRSSDGRTLVDSPSLDAGSVSIIDLVILVDGDYVIEVSSGDETAFGPFELTLNGTIVELPEPDPDTFTILTTPGDLALEATEEVIELAYGTTVNGTLTEVIPTQQFLFRAEEGDIVSISLSGDFDTLLTLRNANGLELETDDDGGSSRDSLIEDFVIPATGEYLLDVSSHEHMRLDTPTAGIYTLQFDGVPAPVIEVIPPEPVAVAYGETVEGSLTLSTPYALYTFEASAGDVVTIQVDSDFDSLLILQDAAENELIVDDDSGDGQDAFVEEYEIEADGIYTIVVDSYDNNSRQEPTEGTYSLTLTEGGIPVTQAEPDEPEAEETAEAAADEATDETTTVQDDDDAATIAPGETVSSELTQDMPSQQFTLQASAGDVITIDLEAEFDAFLFFYDAEGNELASDDDGGAERNARIESLEIPADGVYTIQADSYGNTRLDEPETGTFTLTVTLDDGVPLTEEQPTATPDETEDDTQTDAAPEPTTAPVPPRTGVNPNIPRGTIVDPIPIEIGETVSGELTDEVVNQQYLFSANAGDVITVDMTGDFDTYLFVYDMHGVELARNDDGGEDRGSSISELVIPADGEYVVQADSYGNVGLLEPRGGSYTLTVTQVGEGAPVVQDEPDAAAQTEEPAAETTETETPEAQAAVEVDDAAAITLGETVSGELTEVQPSRQYSFSAVAGDVVTINLEANYDGFLFLYDSDGDELAFNDDGGDDLNSRIEDFEIPADGDYIIQVDSYANAQLGDPRAGSYTLTLTEGTTQAGEPATEDETDDETVDEPETAEVPGEPIPLEYGAVVEGELTEENPQQPYVFSASAGDVVTIDLSATFDTYLLLLDAEGEEIMADDDSGEGFNARIIIEIPADGAYTIIADSYANANVDEPRTGNYTLSLVQTESVSGDEQTDETDDSDADTTTDRDRGDTDLAIGDTITSMLTDAVPEEVWTFSASESDVVTIVLTSEDFDAYLLLYDEAGNEIAFDDDSAGSLNSRIGPLTIPVDGVYAIVASSYEFVGGEEAEQGEYTLSLALSEINRIEYGEQVQNRISQEQSFYVYAFPGGEGDLLTVDLETSSTNIYMSLETEDGEFIAETYGDFEDLGPVTLPADATYILNVSSFDATEAAGFSFVARTVTAQAIEFETDTVVVLDDDQNVYTFEGRAGDTISVTVDSGGTVDTSLRLLGPDGLLLSADEDGGAGFDPEIFRLALPQSGTYTVVVETVFGDASGEVNLRVDPEPAASIDTGAQVVHLSTDVTQSVITFSGSAGEAVALSVRVRAGNTTETYVTVSQDDTIIATNNIGLVERVILEFTVPADGEVRVLIEDYLYAPLTLELELINRGGN